MQLPFWPDPQGYRNIDLGLKRVYDLLERLGNFHLKLPAAIHIAGTNGKGSTLSFLREIFTQAGLKIHTYTSPHLVNFNERIVLDGKEISDKFLNEVLLECKKAAEKPPQIPVTFFEGITVAAFLAFSRVKADILLLEVGMGGRLDATNVLPDVLCSVITPVAFDHTEFLGKTLKEIAFEKAGIIKKNCPVIIGKQKSSALRAIKNKAIEMNSEIKVFAEDYKIKIQQKSWQYFFNKNNFVEFPLPNLAGNHQVENAAVAITAALTQHKFKITDEVIKSALVKVFWPARLQKITTGKFYKKLPKNSELYLDGSHNLQGATTITKFLRSQKKKKVFVIFSMLKDKNCSGFFKKIAIEIDQLIALQIPNEPKSRNADEIKKIAIKNKIKAIEAENFTDAFLKIKSDKPILVLICGSLYLAGEFLRENDGFGLNDYSRHCQA